MIQKERTAEVDQELAAWLHAEITVCGNMIRVIGVRIDEYEEEIIECKKKIALYTHKRIMLQDMQLVEGFAAAAMPGPGPSAQ